MDTLINLTAFSVLSLLWIGFGAALLFQRDLLDRVWRSFRRTPLVAQCVIALFALPVVAGLAVWQIRWPVWLRLVLVAGLAWMTEYTFFPRFPIA